MFSDKKSKRKINFSGNGIHYSRQTNHDACFIPENVRQYKGEPLYILIAHWCMQQKNWVQRSQISEAFHIPPKRASYFISYLRNKTSWVDCECRREVASGKTLRYEIYVAQVLAPSVTGSENIQHHHWYHVAGGKMPVQSSKLWNQLCNNKKAGKNFNME
ncbi:CaiF/GrlA family transcriptional regulator [Salmonella enterica]|nr:CaiF/GrlA family transcriptional regulator [Salmonella enterica]